MQTSLVFLPRGLFSPLFTFTGFLNCLFAIVWLSKRLRHLKLIASEQCSEQSFITLMLKCSAHTGNCPPLYHVLQYDAAFSWACIYFFNSLLSGSVEGLKSGFCN